MAASTTKLGLRKPAGTDLVNVTTDISANMDLIDAACGSKRMFKRTTGSYGITTAAWSALDVTSDLTMKAAVGDWIEVNASGLYDNTGYGANLDVQSMVAAAPVNAWGSVKTGTDFGIMAWYGVAGMYGILQGGMVKQIVAGDLDAGGNVTLRLYGKSSGSGVGKVLSATADSPFTWWAVNLGQP